MTLKRNPSLTGKQYGPIPYDTIDELWRDIEGYEGYYLVSSLGRIYSLRRGLFMRTPPTRYGYLQTVLTGLKVDCPKSILVHTRVAPAFFGPCPIGKEVNHKNGIKSDNRIENLEYVTRRENVEHAYATGLRKLIGGVHCSKSNLTEENVRDIQARWQALGKKKRGFQTDIAREYGVTGSCIYAIVHGKTWNPSRYKHKAVAAP